MRLRTRILGAFMIVVVAAVLTMALVMSHTSACPPAPAPPKAAALMKGIVYRCYGTPAVLSYEDIAKPAPADDEVLVRVRAASVNPLDVHHVEGTPYIVRLDAGFGRPENPRLGVDFAGTVEAVGKNVTRFKPGDEVFGGKFGAFAQYLAVRESRAIAIKPSNVTFEQAAAVPIAALTALQALRDKGQLRAGQRVLINGASGGVGTFAVQIAKALGADVSGVCSTKNVELVRSLGADHVIDYTREDFTRGAQRYDLIVDNVATHSLWDYRRVLTPRGRYVMIGSADSGNWFGWLANPIEGLVLSPLTNQKYGMLLAELNKDDLGALSALMQSGKVTAVIDRSYSLSDAAEALRYLERGHARGKVVLTVE